MNVLSVDPGTARAGWAILVQDKSKLLLIEYGCITTSSTESVEQRLLSLYQDIIVVVQKYKPDVLAIEDLFFAKNAKTAIAVAQARGIILLAAAKQKIPVFSYSPPAVKLAVTGYGKADKRQIQQMVKNILHLSKIPKPDDAADAIAVGLTHCYTKRF